MSEPRRNRRFASTAIRNASRQQNYAQTANAPNSGQPWTAKHMDMVLAAKTTDRELAEKIGRSVQAIQLKRHLLTRGW